MFIAHRFPNSLPDESIVRDVSEVPILGKTLGELQDWAVKLNGGKWSADGIAQLWIREDVHVSHQAIAIFLEACRDSDKDVQWHAEGAAGGFVREIGFDDDTPMMVWLVEPAGLDLDRLNRSEVLPIDVKTYPIQIPAPQEGMGADFVSLPLTDAVVIPVGHWSQTLWGNLLSLGPYLWRELVGDNIKQLNMKGTLYDANLVEEKMGVKPGQILDLLALTGDASDNIPGVPGVGPKTAAKWLQLYEDIDGVKANAKKIDGKVGEKLRESFSNLIYSVTVIIWTKSVQQGFSQGIEGFVP